jgi:HEAT repeat protein
VDPVFLILAGSLALPLWIYAERRVRRKQLQGWRAAAATIGLQEVDSGLSLLGSPWLTARSGRRRVAFKRELRGDKIYVTKVTISGDSGISLRVQRPPRRLERLLDEREIELGDDAFDAEVEVHGAADRVHAMLDAETRTLVRRMLRRRLEPPGQRAVSIHGRVSLEYGHLEAELREDPTPPTPHELAEAVGALLGLADRFAKPASVSERLAGALEREPHWRVRVNGLQLLATSFPNDRSTTPALRRGLADEVPEVRLQAGIALGEEGRATLLEIASAEDVEDATAAHAIDVLGDRFPADAAQSVLRRALRLRRIHSADACIQLLGRTGAAAAAALLCKVLLVEDGPLAVAAARALETCAGADAEDDLLDALGRGPSDLTAPVIAALGRCGSARAVLPIQEAAEDADREARRAARQAVAAIQSRLPGASPGQLSLAGGEAGQLSLADVDPRGRVSLPDAG